MEAFHKFQSFLFSICGNKIQSLALKMETLLDKDGLENCYANDNIPYIVTDNIDDVIKSLKKASIVLFQWLDHNTLSAKPTRWSHTLKQFVGLLLCFV